jgi:ABC-2 type transport system permease protein
MKRSEPAWGKYAAVFLLSFGSVRQRGGELLGRLLFLAILLFIFSHLWQVAFEGSAQSKFTDKELLWYLALTEWVVLSLHGVQVEMERDIQSGQIFSLLSKPWSYPLSQYMEALGHSFANFLILGGGAVGLAWGLSGSFLPGPWTFLRFVPLLWSAVMLGMIFQTIMGLFAFWMLDVQPLAWIWQKAIFILGGLLLPLSFYPDWLERLAMFTPFPAMLFLPATALVEGQMSLALEAMVLQVGWFLGALILVKLLLPKLERTFERIGG